MAIVLSIGCTSSFSHKEWDREIGGGEEKGSEGEEERWGGREWEKKERKDYERSCVGWVEDSRVGTDR